MKKYNVVKNGKIISSYTSDFADETYREDNWGKPERLLIDYPLAPLSEELKAMSSEVSQVEVNGEMLNQYKIPAEYTVEIEDITAESEAQERVTALIAQGEKTSKACKDAFNLIAGYNQFRQMTSEQKNEMTTLFAPIVQALKIYERPSVAKALVSAIVPDGVLVTEQMKADMLEVLKDF